MSIVKYLKEKTELCIRPYIVGTYENIVKNKSKILSSYQNKKRIKDLLVSMTTYEPRILFFEYSVLSILAGSVLPEKIYIYVPKGFIDLLHTTGSILETAYKDGIAELVEMEEDVYCHSKYYYVFQAYGKEKDIVLCDDDVVYYRHWLAHLIDSAHKDSKHHVFAYKAVCISTNDEGFAPYDEWQHCSNRQVPKDCLLYAEAVGGVFYRRGILSREVLNKEKFLEIVPKADDVWLFFCSYLNQAPIKYLPTKNNAKLLYTIPNSQETALWKENTFAKRNDQYMSVCHAYFKAAYGMDIMEEHHGNR